MQSNAYASETEMTRSKTTKEEFSEGQPSLYAVTVLAGEFDSPLLPPDDSFLNNNVMQ